MVSGRVYGIGVGPGDPELMTLKAVRLLSAVSVVAYPAPLEGDGFARRIAAAHLRPEVEEVPIRMPMEAARFPAMEVYDRATEVLGARLEEGRDVAVLCQGDPFLYGSFMYLFGRLAERFPVEVVPGVSSLTACAAAAGRALASRNDVLAVLPAPLDDEALAARLAAVDAAVIVKIGRHLPRIRALLDRLGLTDEARLVVHATLPDQRVVPLRVVGDEPVPYFSTVLLHKRGHAWRSP